MNRFICLQAKSRHLHIYTALRVISRLFSTIMQCGSRINAKTRAQTLYQYLSPLVCLHSYNDTVNANAEVIIEHRFAAIQQIRGCKFLTHTSSRSILIKTIPLCRHGQLSAHRLNGRVVSTKFCLFQSPSALSAPIT